MDRKNRSHQTYGLFRTDLTTQYYWGIPRNVIASGMMTDIDRYYTISTQKDNNQQAWVQNMQAIGARASAMEARVPEQLFSTTDNPAHGISAVDAIQLAASQGQRIYTITQSNIDIALPNLNLPQEVIDGITNAVAAGKIVTAHQSPVNFYGSNEVGYIATDPNTGAGAYEIAGASGAPLFSLKPVLNNVSEYWDTINSPINSGTTITGLDILKQLVFALDNAVSQGLNILDSVKSLIDMIDILINGSCIGGTAETLLAVSTAVIVILTSIIVPLMLLGPLGVTVAVSYSLILGFAQLYLFADWTYRCGQKKN